MDKATAQRRIGEVRFVHGTVGWGVGIRDAGSPWLTVLGSHYGHGVYGSEESARAAAATYDLAFGDVTVAQVRAVRHSGVESGYAFRVLDAAVTS